MRKDHKKKKATTQVKAPSPTVKTVEIKKEDLEDLGKCGTCEQPLRRTAYNREMDAVRCVNPRCNLFRQVQKRIHLKSWKPVPAVPATELETAGKEA